MADPKGFLTTPRRDRRRGVRSTCASRTGARSTSRWTRARSRRRPAAAWTAASRSATSGCPLGNLIPEWNDLVWRDDWREAIERLHATNNFPEFTGRLCPAPCETACVLGINADPVTIKQVEVSIIDRAWDEGWRHAAAAGRGCPAAPSPSSAPGPAGLAAAQQLTRAGHTVAVLRAGRPRSAGCCATASPSSRWRSATSTGGWTQMEAEGTRFRAGVNVGVDVTGADLRKRYDAVVLATGATVAATCPSPGRELAGIHQAMEYLPLGQPGAGGRPRRGADHRRRASTS